MTDLEKNRVYDIGEIETLKNSAINLLSTGIDSCLSWDNSVLELHSLQSQTPVKSLQLSGALNGVSGKLYQPDYETDKCWIEGALNNVITNIPQQDVAGADLLEPLNENLQLIMGMTEDLAECIEAAGTNLTLAEFREKLEEIKQDWDNTTLEENLEKFETILLGIPTYVLWSAGFYENVNKITELYSLNWREFLKYTWIDEAVFFWFMRYLWKTKRIEEKVKGFIPQKINNNTFLTVFNILANLSDIPEAIIEQNAVDNAAFLADADSPLSERGFIENQSEWAQIKFGIGKNANMAYAGCGIIATYNALYALKEEVSAQTMVELISYYERDGAVLGGAFGVAPNAITEYFTEKGYNVEETSDRESDAVNRIGEEYETVIVTVYNDEKDITQQVHTVSITKETNGTFTVHNVSGINNKGEDITNDSYETLQEAIENISDQKPLVINVIGISIPEQSE